MKRSLVNTFFFCFCVMVCSGTWSHANNLLTRENQLMQRKIDSLYGVRDSLELSIRYLSRSSHQETQLTNKKRQLLLELKDDIGRLQNVRQKMKDSLTATKLTNDSLSSVIAGQSDIKDALIKESETAASVPRNLDQQTEGNTDQAIHTTRFERERAEKIKLAMNDLKDHSHPTASEATSQKDPSKVQTHNPQTSSSSTQVLSDYLFVGLTFVATFSLILWQGKSSQH